MSIEIVMPGESAAGADGVVVRWLAEEGQALAAGDVIAEVETDKAIVELTAPQAGVLAARVAGDHQILPAGAVAAVVATDGEDAEAVRKQYPPAAEPPQEPLAEGVVRAVPLTGVRGAVSDRVMRSAREIPQFQVTVDCHVDEFLALRRKLKRDRETRRVNVNAMTLKCAAAALKQHPIINSTIVDGVIYEHSSTDINLAVAVPGGVVMPIIRDVQGRSLMEVSAAIDAVVEAARHRRLRPEDLEVGSFSVSSLGSFGVRDFTALILPPQVGILAVGTIRNEPVIRDGELALGHKVSLTISVDHRAIDGAVAAEFMQSLQKNIVEQPEAVLGG